MKIFNSRFKGKVKKNKKSNQSEIDGMSEPELVIRIPRITQFSASSSLQTEVHNVPNEETTDL
jgi:hypothetical protein